MRINSLPLRQYVIHIFIPVVIASAGFPAVGSAEDRLDRSKLGKLTFSDEFDGAKLSLYEPRTKRGTWKTSFFYGDQNGSSSRRAQETIFVEPAYSGVNPFFLEEGKVSLELRSVTRPNDPKLDGAKFTAGLLSTERTFSQTYGYWEARIAMPDVPGTWPAFWLWSSPVKDLTGTQWNGEWTGGLDDEIDIVEGQGVRPGKTLHTAHKRFKWKDRTGGERVEFKKVESLQVDIKQTAVPRTYGLLWTREELVWYVDDERVYRCSNHGWRSPMYIILSMGAGGWDGNDIRAGFDSARLGIDYVRVYTLEKASQTIPN
ncbi:glycoside hydrolase family 16 protein [Paludisphaera rhizosphaerae]|uniref:glycoside hydrolase family 16 protein n=1 Tax=Paludisphaera rhizosphaerae TaxID=2711216 RepID=UPI0013EBB191|nr:glycoside hydrolase family 16 protein [Paludisphaera rhizosphaerae]